MRWTRNGAVAIGLGVLLAAPGGAVAKPRWIEGQMQRSTVVSCASLVAGAPVYTAGILAQTGFRADPKRLPKAGRTFYARMFIGGAGDPCVTQVARLELVLPLGVRTAVSRRARVRCSYFTSPDVPAAPLSAAEGCPRRAYRPQELGYGNRGTVMFPRTTRADGLWELPRGTGYFIDVPLRSKRRLRGIQAGLPDCSGLPCTRREVRDNLQAAIFVSDGNTNPWVLPHVGLFVRRG